MKWKALNKSQALAILHENFDEYGKTMRDRAELKGEEKKLEEALFDAYAAALTENNERRDYGTDLSFGLRLFTLFNTSPFKMTLYEAADVDIWRYISVVIAPEIIMDRWHKEGKQLPLDHFCTKTQRIYLKSLWWYIYLSWQGSAEETKQILLGNSTDTILNLVERSGQTGYEPEVYRAIMYKFSNPGGSLPAHQAALFRKVMKLHTAWSTNVEPALYSGGIPGYVKELFAYFS
ncbi:DUF6339 family protein [Megasphaera sp. CLA-AA-H81]|uniref:DUF6339 family protein n=1 Tax=Megasphaera intestinihominis TaxID=3133159 RepID=A0ABV1CYA8_9FIRM|nr:DUF6339 family protein [uncultured Megasphaera sp.]